MKSKAIFLLVVFLLNTAVGFGCALHMSHSEDHEAHHDGHKHHHEHVHFKCTTCGLTTCLDHVIIPNIILPEGYQRVETNLLMQGVCKTCSF